MTEFFRCDLMEHPPKQGLKLSFEPNDIWVGKDLMEHPPKQGLKHIYCQTLLLATQN